MRVESAATSSYRTCHLDMSSLASTMEPVEVGDLWAPETAYISPVRSVISEHVIFKVASNGNLDDLKLLVSAAGFDCSAELTSYGQNILHVAASAGCLAAVVWLLTDSDQALSTKLNINHRDRNDESVLDLAVSRGDVDMVRFLLSKGSVAASEEYYFIGLLPPFLMAARLGYLDIMKVILDNDRNVDPHVISSGGNGVNHAMCGGHLDCVEWLLDLGVGFDEYDSLNEISAIGGAAMYGHWHILEALRIKGIDVLVCSDDVLYGAVLGGHLQTVEYVLGLEGIDVNQPCQRIALGESLMSIAQSIEKDSRGGTSQAAKICQLLESHGAKLP